MDLGLKEKHLALRQQTVLQGKPSPALTEHDLKIEAIANYVEKFATIANRAITPQLLSIYIEALEEFELRRIKKGLARALQGVKSWPWPAELIDWIEDEI
jgi:hypothetical protein